MPLERQRQAGFNLMEVLLAVAIFAVGFVAVASLLPAGAVLQRQTSDEVQSLHERRNAEAKIDATELTYQPGTLTQAWTPGVAGAVEVFDPVSGQYYVAEEFDLSDEDEWREAPDLYFYHHTYSPPQENFPNPERKVLRPFMVDGDEPGRLPWLWSLETRSYPSTKPNLTYVADRPNMNEPGDYWVPNRDFYWVPMVRDAAGNAARPRWEMYVFVLKRQDERVYEGAEYPLDGQESGERYLNLPGLRRLIVERPAEEATGEARRTFTVMEGQGNEWLDELRTNDRIVDNLGAIYQVVDMGDNWIEVDQIIRLDRQRMTMPSASGGFELNQNIGDDRLLPDEIWFAPRGVRLDAWQAGQLGRIGGPSPAHTIFHVHPWVTEPVSE